MIQTERQEVAMAKNNTKNTIITIVFVLIFAVAIFGIYHYVKGVADKRAKEKAERESEPTEIQNIVAVNLELSYPETARAVVKFYCRILKALHNDDPTETEISQLQFQLRKIYDQELLDNNSVANQLNALKLEIMEYDDLNRTIDDYIVDASGNAETWTSEDKSYYRIIANISIKENGTFGTLYEEFILRKDEDGRWKILGWRRVDADGLTK